MNTLYVQLTAITREQIEAIVERKQVEAIGATANRYLATVSAVLR
jgi:hypothetical protein